jgi:hypothetical protein
MVPDGTIRGDCGTVTFVNYYNDNFYVIIDSPYFMDGMGYTISAGGRSTSGKNAAIGYHTEFPVYWAGYPGGVATLTGTVFVWGVVTCTIIPNQS